MCISRVFSNCYTLTPLTRLLIRFTPVNSLISVLSETYGGGVSFFPSFFFFFFFFCLGEGEGESERGDVVMIGIREEV